MVKSSRIVALAAAAIIMVVPLAAPAAAKTDPKQDKTTAQEGVLDMGDFPAGWKDTGPQSSSSFSASSCSKIKSAESSAKKYVAKSHDFESTTGFAENSVYVFPTTAAAKSYLKPFMDTGKQCLLDSAKKELKGAKINVDAIDASALVDGVSADDGLVFRITVTQGTTTTVVIQAAVRLGRAVDGFTFGDSTGTTLPEADDLVIASVDRLTTALG